ncbi:unnamed protein product [Ectocarpus sp. 6 AP-2014]
MHHVSYLEIREAMRRRRRRRTPAMNKVQAMRRRMMTTPAMNKVQAMKRRKMTTMETNKTTTTLLPQTLESSPALEDARGSEASPRRNAKEEPTHAGTLGPGAARAHVQRSERERRRRTRRRIRRRARKSRVKPKMSSASGR